MSIPTVFPAAPTDTASASWNFFYNLPGWIYQEMEMHGDGGKKVWMTEFGAPTGSATSDGAVSEQQQAQMITEAFSEAEQWAWAGPLFVYDWQDGSDAGSVYDNFGLLDASWNAKPALAAFENSARQLLASRGFGSILGPASGSSVIPSQRTSTGTTFPTGPATAAAGWLQYGICLCPHERISPTDRWTGRGRPDTLGFHRLLVRNSEFVRVSMGTLRIAHVLHDQLCQGRDVQARRFGRRVRDEGRRHRFEQWWRKLRDLAAERTCANRIMKTFLVSGSSTGIGEACALRLDRLGHRVYAGVRKEEDAAQLSAKASERLVPVRLDVTDDSQIAEVARRIEQEAGLLNGVVNNAGIAKGGPLEYLPLEVWREQLEVNVLGHVAVTRALLPWIRRGNGRIVFVGSISGKVSTSLMGPYGASKFAIEAIAESLRQELHPWRIWVSVIEPGAVKTAIWEKGRREADNVEQMLPAEAKDLYASHVTAIRKGIEMQDRNGVDPDKVARAVQHALFSARPKARYLVGMDARVQSALARLVPQRPREAIIRRFAGP